MISVIEKIAYVVENGSCETQCKYKEGSLVGAWMSCQGCDYFKGMYKNDNVIICRYLDCQINEAIHSKEGVTKEQLNAIKIAISNMENYLNKLKELEGEE